MPIRTVAEVAKEMKLVGIDDQTAINATNKYEMRKALKKGGVPIPLFYKVSTIDELNAVLPNFKEKFITKPADNSGSRGIYLVDDKSKAFEAFEYSKANSRNGDVVVEEYMQGPEVSVETLTLNGVCHVIQITDKLTTGAPHFVEMGHSQPSQLSPDIQKRIKEVAIAANRAIGIKNGPSHTEIIVTKDGPKIVELGARLGGDCITTHLVPLSTGVNMVECCIKMALGLKPDLEIKINKGSAIRYFEQHKGWLKNIEGIEKAKKVSGVVDIYTAVNNGEAISDIDNSASRFGFVIAQAKNSKKAIAQCNKAMNKIKINIES